MITPPNCNGEVGWRFADIISAHRFRVTGYGSISDTGKHNLDHNQIQRPKNRSLKKYPQSKKYLNKVETQDSNAEDEMRSP